MHRLKFSVLSIFTRPLVDLATGDWVSQKQPDQTGWDGSPRSKSTHTSAPTGGSISHPTPGPAYGRLGIAQAGVAPSTSATVTSSMPVPDSSALETTFRDICRSTDQASGCHHRGGTARTLSGQREGLCVGARLEGCATLLT